MGNLLLDICRYTAIIKAERGIESTFHNPMRTGESSLGRRKLYSTCRMFGVGKHTVLRLLEDAGRACTIQRIDAAILAKALKTA